MNTKLVTILLLGSIAVGGYIFFRGSTLTPNQTGPGPKTEDVRAAVISFGSKIKNVSLLGSKTQIGEEMEVAYGPHLTPELLARWKANPSEAVGRQTSSPTPDRIEIVSISPLSLTSYTVEGNILEVAQRSGGTTTAAVLPVTLKLDNRNGTWLISELSKGVYGTIPQEITVSGTFTCLPHKNSEGPQTLECAFGLKSTSGKNYALDLSKQTDPSLQNLPTDTKITVTGIFTPIEMISTNMWQNYDTVGILSVTSITQ